MSCPSLGVLGCCLENDPAVMVQKVCKNGHSAERYRATCGNWPECVECRRLKNKRTYEKNFTHRVAGRMLNSACERAKKASVPFSITKADIEAIWPSDNRCPIFGKIFTRGRQGGGPLPESATLDRIRPKQGYVRGNIAIISARANSIKQAETDPGSLRRVADWMEKEL